MISAAILPSIYDFPVSTNHIALRGKIVVSFGAGGNCTHGKEAVKDLLQVKH